MIGKVSMTDVSSNTPKADEADDDVCVSNNDYAMNEYR